jgi:hypothetical protein
MHSHVRCCATCLVAQHCCTLHEKYPQGAKTRYDHTEPGRESHRKESPHRPPDVIHISAADPQLAVLVPVAGWVQLAVPSLLAWRFYARSWLKFHRRFVIPAPIAGVTLSLALVALMKASEALAQSAALRPTDRIEIERSRSLSKSLTRR